MARKFVMIGAALAALAFAAPVAAQSVDEDVRCLLAANVFADHAPLIHAMLNTEEEPHFKRVIIRFTELRFVR